MDMRATRLTLVPLLAVLACGDDSNNSRPTGDGDSDSDGDGDSDSDGDECAHNEFNYPGAFNGDSPWSESSYCDEIYVCVDAAAAQTLSEELGWQCQVHRGPGYCNVDGEVQCILATEVIVTEQHVADACTALTLPGIEEVFCAKF